MVEWRVHLEPAVSPVPILATENQGFVPVQIGSAREKRRKGFPFRRVVG